MTAVIWANVLLAIPFLIAVIGVPLWMTFKRPQTVPDHSQAHAYLRSKAAFAEAGAVTPTPVTSGAGFPPPARGQDPRRPQERGRGWARPRTGGRPPRPHPRLTGDRRTRAGNFIGSRRSEHTMHVLLNDDQGRLTLRRLWPWHRMLARSRAGRLDLELAGGTSPEASAALAARAMRLTSMEFRCGLAASLQRILTAAGEPVVLRPQLVTGRSPFAGSGRSPLAVTARPPRIPLRLARISQSAPRLAALAGQLVEPGRSRRAAWPW